MLALLFLATLIFTSELQADSSNLYSLGKVGGLVISSNDIENIQIVGLVVGLRIDNALYLEAELNTSVSGGHYFNGGEKGQLNVTNFNLYGVYRYVFNGRFYGKLKAGIASNSLQYDISNSIDANNNSRDFDGLIGLGLGIVSYALAHPFMIELEYAIIDKDISLFTIGMTKPF